MHLQQRKQQHTKDKKIQVKYKDKKINGYLLLLFLALG
ncbi:hypothetical protein BVRB_6g145300 [Beta vulgaris subsp. vulgaris]|uniref:Uncharacterized protein n=1 Tax=Beta vulgaris subsp. vulgaris TaxID=3555 RepID=A0A0J8EXH1_BETVV|nr:hypothetical protein BVRB_6g145300 [Beta vulgaris subsp. vulgaris]